MKLDLNNYTHIFFIGIAGSGMSALAQYLKGCGKIVSGSDRYFTDGIVNDTRNKLSDEGITCFSQTGEGINKQIDLIIVSTAIEDTVEEVQKAKALRIPIIKRSELLALICEKKKTIAIAGTSGKSTVSAMLYHILKFSDLAPGIISGAGLTALIKQGKIGNADAGNSDILVIEADESDGSIVQYHPHTGVLLNVDKDHQEIDVLMDIFTVFKSHCTQHFLVNESNTYAQSLSSNNKNNFGVNTNAPFNATNFVQDQFEISFLINDVQFKVNAIGEHSMQNALAAAATAHLFGVPLTASAAALIHYEGIYRRHQILGQKNNVWLVDDYAHNPAKCAASIRAVQPVSNKVIAWFQPHGYGPTRFLKNDFIAEISAALRPDDEIWMSEIFYAGGTATKDISAKELIDGITAQGKQAFFVEDRAALLAKMKAHFTPNCVLLLMGARDPSLADFANDIWNNL